MTRGRFVLITDDYTYMSLEFNGDMYPDGHGLEVKSLLELVHSKEDFDTVVDVFLETMFSGYGEEEGNRIFLIDDLDFRRDYFKRFGSDYLYIKNIGTNTAVIISKETGDIKDIAPGEIQCWNFGKLVTDPQYDTFSKEVLDAMIGTAMIRIGQHAQNTGINDIVLECKTKIGNEYLEFKNYMLKQPGFIVYQNAAYCAAMEKAYSIFMGIFFGNNEVPEGVYTKLLDAKEPLNQFARWYQGGDDEFGIGDICNVIGIDYSECCNE